jgi:hypothetical protein
MSSREDEKRMTGTSSVRSSSRNLSRTWSPSTFGRCTSRRTNSGIVEEVDELVVAGDGADALDYLVGEGPHVGRATTTMPCLRMASWT